MGAPKGNQFWKLVAREDWASEKKYSSPKELWEKGCEYFEYMDKNPWQKVDAAKAGDRFGEHVVIPTPRPYTLSGLCLYLGITEQTLSNYEKKEGYEAYFGVAHTLKRICYTQKYEGAAVGAFSASIISRDLGLVEKKDFTTAGDKLGDVIKVEVVPPKDDDE